jgi:hypothetical protein
MRAGPSFVLAACLLAPGAVCAQEFHPIPPEQVEGRRLIAREANFSVEAPGDKWAWSVAEIPNGRMYACRRLADNVSFAVIHRADGQPSMTEAAFQAFLDGAVSALREEGFTVAAVTRQEVAQPFPGSIHFRASLTEEIDSVNRLVGFAGARGNLYALTALVGTDDDERVFTEFARTFRLLQSRPGLTRITSGVRMLDGLVLVLACGAILWLAKSRINRRARRPDLGGAEKP